MAATSDPSGDRIITGPQGIPDHFSRLCDSLADAVVIDDNHHILQVNRRAEALFGYSRGELEGRLLESILAPDIRQPDRRLSVKAANPRDRAAMWTGGLHGIRKDGAPFAIEIIRSHIKVDGADLFCSVVRDLSIIMFTDVITERKHAESRLRESEALLRGLVKTSPIPMLVVTADADSRVLLMNQRFTKTFGYSIQDVPDISAWWVRAYPDPAYRDRVRASWHDAIAEAERTDDHAIAPVMAQVTCKDGSIRDLEVHMGRFGNRALVVFSDLTERKHTEELLRQSEERYRLIVENQTEFIVKWLPDGRRTFVNDSYCRTFGVREQDCVGTSFLPLVAPEYRESIRQLTAALTPEAPEYTDEYVSLVQGGQRWQQWTNRGIFDVEGALQPESGTRTTRVELRRCRATNESDAATADQRRDRHLDCAVALARPRKGRSQSDRAGHHESVVERV